MQTIIGSGGSIATELARALKENYTDDIRLVSRNPKKVNESDLVFAADVLHRDQLKEAIRGSEIVYITVGFTYSYKVWQKNWPTFIANAIDICAEEGCKLVFFDNIYMYSEDALNGMTEAAQIDPPGKKGKVRAEIADMIMEAARSGKIKALIARCADFYGPNVGGNGILRQMVINPLKEGKKANWLGSINCKHSFTYTIDAGIGTALLGNTDDAYNDVWHLPTASNPPTGKEWIEMVAQEMGVKPKYQVASKFTLRVLGLFMPIMRELVEMVYEYDRDYVFDSSKFENRFGYEPTSYKKGLQMIFQTESESNQS